MGCVRWLDPTDVRGLDLDATVEMDAGSIEVYMDSTAGGTAAKPEVGRGLNKPAEVTMLGVHKLDRASGAPTQDQAAIDK